MKIKYAVFDLDGTLLYTLDTIRYHLNRTLLNNGADEISLRQCSEYIGNGAKLLVTRAANASGITDEALISKILGEYNEAYNSEPLPYTYPYPGVQDLVLALIARGITVGVVTNKPEPTARQLVSRFFGDGIAFVRGGRPGIVLKPDPTDTLDALATVGGVAGECIFVGDTSVDIETGKNMGAAFSVGVLWGFRDRCELEGAGADLVVVDPMKILDAINEYEEN